MSKRVSRPRMVTGRLSSILGNSAKRIYNRRYSEKKRRKRLSVEVPQSPTSLLQFAEKDERDAEVHDGLIRVEDVNDSKDCSRASVDGLPLLRSEGLDLASCSTESEACLFLNLRRQGYKCINCRGRISPIVCDEIRNKKKLVSSAK